MNAAVLPEPGRWKLPEISRRAVVSVAIASLHALIIYLLATVMSSRHYRGLDASVLEIDVLPADRPLPKPPSFPQVMLVTSRPIAPPPLPITIDLPVDPGPVSQSIDTQDVEDQAQSTSVARTTSPTIDPFPVLRPRPISGPHGADRYPNESMKAKESGAVIMTICVSAQGKVESVEVTHSSGFPRLDKAALGIASEYVFQPATHHNHPVAACAPYRIVFEVR